ncbi:MAG: exopolysaccharide Pel transporter PelG [Roseburia sp.]|nr:exopolysaccharide Pel transporter PelG [Roseburia sp.]
MAGIGFELKKMFEKRGLLSIIRAYGYAGVVCTGPMILGVLLLLGVRFLARIAGTTEGEIEFLNAIVQYTMLFSMILSNGFTLVTTRYVSDWLYMNKPERVMPAFWGCTSLMLVIGIPCYILFMSASKLPLLYLIFSIGLFGELILVWTEIHFLTAIKDYEAIMKTFLVAVIVAFATGSILFQTSLDVVAVMLIAVNVAYGVMAVWYYVLMAQYFPKGRCSSLHFLKWFDKYPQLSFLGVFLSIGVYGHIFIMWTWPIGKQIYGLMYVAPEYDIPALLAFMSTLITTINFISSVEVKFYAKYKIYFNLFNDGGSYIDIEQAEREMKTMLVQELAYTFSKQFFATIVFIVVGTVVLPQLPLGMTEDMLGIFRVLCVGYAFYAIGNTLMLIQLYFSDNKGALVSVMIFSIISCLATLLLRNVKVKYYGVGFMLGGIAFTLTAVVLLFLYLKKLVFYVLCSQPIVAIEKRGKLTEWGEYFEQKYRKKYHIDIMEESEEE